MSKKHKASATKNFELAVLWTDGTWTDDHYARGANKDKAEKALLSRLEKEGAKNVSHVTVVCECNADDEEDEKTPQQAVHELLELADSSDAQLIDALHMIETMIADPKSSPAFIRAQMEDLANDVEPHDPSMATDLRFIAETAGLAGD